MIDTQYYDTLAFSYKEALRYLGFCGVNPDDNTLRVLEEIRAEAEAALSPAVCWTEQPIERKGKTIGISVIETESESLKRNLSGCERAVLFCATVGIGLDRLLIKYGKTNALKCALLQAAGAVYTESLCDRFCQDLQTRYKGEYLRPRFSPGYGDFPLQVQSGFFRLLTPEKRIGVTLNESLMMSPSKSVTAVVGIGTTPCISGGKDCTACEKRNCAFRIGE